MGRDLRGRPHRHARRFVTNPASATRAYQFLGAETYKQTSTEPIPTGDVTVKMLFEIDEPKPGAGGKGDTLGERQAHRRGHDAADGRAALHDVRRNGHRPRQRWRRRPFYDDNASYAFTGTVKNVVIDLKPATHTPARHEDEKALHGWKGKRTGATGQACRPAGPRSSRVKGISEILTFVIGVAVSPRADHRGDPDAVLPAGAGQRPGVLARMGAGARRGERVGAGSVSSAKHVRCVADAVNPLLATSGEAEAQPHAVVRRGAA